MVEWFDMTITIDACRSIMEHILRNKKKFLTQAGLIFWNKDDLNPEKEPLEKIKLEHLIFHFALLGVGTTAALIVFTCEIVCGKCKFEKF